MATKTTTNNTAENGESASSGSDRGQTTVALAGVLALTVLLGLGLAVIADAMVHRSQARNAADAVALAAAVDADAAAELGGWYTTQGIDVTISEGYAAAVSGPSQAQAWAQLGESTTAPAPVVVAIVARAEQLIGISFIGPRLRGMRVELSAADASLMHGVAAELGLCVVVDPTLAAGWQVFEVC